MPPKLPARGAVAVALTAAVLLAGCGDRAADGNAGGRGRYLGVGTFSVGPLWAQMAVSDPPKDVAAATIADDEHVIVVVDSRTGEVRQCGDHSGYCVRFDPWRARGAQVAPVRLSKHAADLSTETTEPPK